MITSLSLAIDNLKLYLVKNFYESILTILLVQRLNLCQNAPTSRGEQSLLTTGVKLWNAYLMGGADWASRSAWKVDGLPVGVWFIADWVASLVPNYLTMPLFDFFILVNWNFTYSHAETKTKKIQKNDKESY